jgi:membrane peptidoglycan carboxypeptidase
MASAYATFASRGVYCTPVAIESITQKVGDQEKSLAVPKTSCSRAMSQKTADTVNTLLQGVIDSGTGQQAGLSDRDNAGKTGTTDERKNAWFVGYTPNLAGAVWVGSATQQVKMTNIRIGGVMHGLVYGADVPGPIWRDAMTGALQGKASPSFHLVDIPDGGDKGKGPGGGNENGGTGNGDTNGSTGDDGGGVIGGLIGGPAGGATGTGGGTGNGGPFPTPTFSFPPGFIQGQDGGIRGQRGNGGRHG